nr:hypothetical protein [Moraxella sp.]
MNIFDVIYDRELGGNPMPEDEARCVGCGFEGTKKQVKDGLCACCRDMDESDSWDDLPF